MTDKPELVSTLTGYSECRCILSQYCDGKCRPIYELKPSAHLTIPGALEWDQLPGPVEIEYPEYSEQGMGCGLEDRGITDRYEAMRYGYDEALDQFARILDGYGPLYTHAGTHGVVGTHSADGAHSESAYDDAKEACAEIERAGAPGDVIREMNDELVDLRAQLANTEQSRRSFFDLSQDLEKRLVEHKALLLECQPALEKSGYSTWQIDDLLSASTEPATDHSVDTAEMAKAAEPNPYVAMTEAEADEFLSSFGGGSGNKAKRRIAAMEAAKQKTCIECDQPYCHGVCVERGDQGYDRDQAAKGGDDE